MYSCCLPECCPFNVDIVFCVEVVEEDRSCAVSVTSSPLHVARPSSNGRSDLGRLHCGTKSQPWLLETTAGQRINISLLDFTPLTASSNSDDPVWAAHTSSVDGRSGCWQSQQWKPQYGYVIDKLAVHNKMNVSVCGGDGSRRLTGVYESTANMVELVLDSHETGVAMNNSVNILVKVEGNHPILQSFYVSSTIVIFIQGALKRLA